MKLSRATEVRKEDLHLLTFPMNLQEAGDAPRIDHLGSTDPTEEKPKEV